MAQQQVAIAGVLVNTFFGAAHKDMKVEEVQHGDADLEHETLFGFGESASEEVLGAAATPEVEDEDEDDE